MWCSVRLSLQPIRPLLGGCQHESTNKRKKRDEKSQAGEWRHAGQRFACHWDKYGPVWPCPSTLDLLRGARQDGWGFWLTAGPFHEHLLCPGRRGLYRHRVTWCSPSPVTSGEDAEAQEMQCLAQGQPVRGRGRACWGHLLSPPGPISSAVPPLRMGHFLCPWAGLPRDGPLTPDSEPPGPGNRHVLRIARR